MKIISNNLKQEYPKQCICEHCKSIIEIDEYDVTDIEVKGFDPRDQEPYKYKIKGFKCPACDKETKINKL